MGSLVDRSVSFDVLLPVFVCVCLLSVLTALVERAMRPLSWGSSICFRARCAQHILQRARALAQGEHLLSERSFRKKRADILNDMRQTIEDEERNGKMISATLMMLDNMKGGLGTRLLVGYAAQYGPLLLMGLFVNYFFVPAVVVARLPFQVPHSLAAICHMGLRGSGSSLLPSNYLSSLSWYVLCLFGTRGLSAFLPRPAERVQSFSSQLMGFSSLLGSNQTEGQAFKRARDELMAVEWNGTYVADATKRLLEQDF